MKPVYDLLIAILIIGTALPAVILLWHRIKDKKSWEWRHSRTSFFIALLLLCGTALLVWGSFIEPRLLVLQEDTIDIEHIVEPVTVALVSDFQVGPYKRTSYIERIVDRILLYNPDVVLIAGDQINNSLTFEDETVYLAPIKALADRIPTYVIHGNHEYGLGHDLAEGEPITRLPDLSSHTKNALQDLGAVYLVNELTMVTSTPSPFYLYGSDEWWNRTADFTPLAAREQTDVPTIGLIHNPAAVWEASKHDIDLMVSGHTHGGQIRLPFIGPFGRVDRVIPGEWYQGLFSHNEMQVYVTSGTGESGPRARLFNPPEIVILTLI